MADPPPPPSSRSAATKTGHVESGSGEAADPELAEVQLALRELGFYGGEPDGLGGPGTTQAIREFQTTHGLVADGIVGAETVAAVRRVRGASAEPPGTPAPAPAAPLVLAVLRGERDADDAARLVGAVTSAAPADELIAVPVTELDELGPDWLARVTLVVPCISEAFLGEYGERPARVALDLARRGQIRIAPLRLDDTDLARTPYAEHQALGGGVPLRAVSDPDAFLRSVAAELVDLARRRRGRATLPRFSADSLDGEILLDRRGKIEFLGSVLAAKQLETPLAVGLFGDWGSGKSFFMRRLQEQVVALTEASAKGAGEGRPSLYCSHVRHVAFNAWLYSGADVWSAFAAQVFREVASRSPEVSPAPTQRDDLLAFQQRLVAKQESRQRVAALERELAEKEQELDALQPDAGRAGKFVGTLREIGTRLLGLRHGWRDLRAGDVLLMVAIGLVIAASAVFHTSLAWLFAAAAAVLAVVRYVDEARRLRQDVNRIRAQIAAEKEAQAAAPAADSDGPRPELLLPAFAEQEAAEWSQRAQVGPVTQIRLKFEELSRLIAQGVRERERPEAAPADAVPLERVIVYVDDLDRCQPDVVVEVLETLKLLVSLPHFVAVVGVDSRWLFRSLELHFRDLLGNDDGATSDAAVWSATPQNYLEKIFQYSLVLQPLGAGGFGMLIEDLLGSSAAAATPPATASPEPPTDDAAAPTEPHAPAGEAAAERSPADEASPELDLTPDELVITREEIEFIKGLAPMFETPRAAKRLANVYRLLRVSVGAERLVQAESYEPVLLLLAIGIGFPGLAGETFAEIPSGEPTTLWPDFVQALGSELRARRGLLDSALSKLAPGDPNARTIEQSLQLLRTEAEAKRRLRAALEAASSVAVADRTLETFVPWIQVVAEFSFHPWQELLPPTATS